MSGKVRWGVLGVAKIAVEKVIPAMQRGAHCEIAAIASRDAGRAHEAASRLGIPKAYGTYEELLADPDIDAVYNPLPNHLHLPLSARAAEAGKHVLCEKPITLTATECCELIEVRDRTGVLIGEAFMVATHPQWLRAREILRAGEIGAPRSILTAFSYFNRDPANIRNVASYGGGALMDIGCYPVFTSRFLLGEEPAGVQALIETDPEFRVDVLTSGLMRFPSADSVFTCGTRQAYYQRTQIFGERGIIEIEIPFNAPPDRPCRIFVEIEGRRRVEEFPVCDQYTIQGDEFSRAIMEGGQPPVSLETALGNMTVIEALFRSAASGAMVPIADT
jgi:predicted dehydrogenase